MTTRKSRLELALSIIFYIVVVLCLGNVVLTCYGCAAIKPACAVVNLVDMACDTIAVEYVDPSTGKKSVVQVKKETLTGAVKAAAQKDGVAPQESK